MPYSPTTESHLQHVRAEIETALDRYTRWGDKVPTRLAEAVRYSLLAPGKRLRPLLAYLSCQLCGGAPEKAVPAACAVEMIHCYSLIHDDLPAMDDDDLRRGRPTCHKQFDEATAILAGDALQAVAFELLATAIDDPVLAGKCCAALAIAAGPKGMVGGQADDVSPDIYDKIPAEKRPERIDWLKAIHHRKTAALIRVPIQLGAMIGAASGAQLEALDQYGQHLGLAFQITDDLLDLKSEFSICGKETGRDSGKNTYVTLAGEERARAYAEELAQAAVTAAERFPTPGFLIALAKSLTTRGK